jgi:ribosomal protein S18 acetylase RimI-like enzyme
MMQMLSAGEAAHKEAAPGPHWYLVVIAVEPEHHGQGIGSALIQHGLKRVDADGLPCYLETSNERNVPLYERYGFKIAHTDLLPDNGPRYWGMLRTSVS